MAFRTPPEAAAASSTSRTPSSPDEKLTSSNNGVLRPDRLRFLLVTLEPSAPVWPGSDAVAAAAGPAPLMADCLGLAPDGLDRVPSAVFIADPASAGDVAPDVAPATGAGSSGLLKAASTGADTLTGKVSGGGCATAGNGAGGAPAPVVGVVAVDVYVACRPPELGLDTAAGAAASGVTTC